MLNTCMFYLYWFSCSLIVIFVKVFEVIEFLASHGLACESGDDGTGQFVAIAKHCEQLRGHGQNRQVQIILQVVEVVTYYAFSDLFLP